MPYSSHSNYRELERFCKAIQPRNMVFTVPDRDLNPERLKFQKYLISEYVEKPHKGLKKEQPMRLNLLANPPPLPRQVNQVEEEEKARATEKSLTERFNPNNIELNKQRFML